MKLKTSLRAGTLTLITLVTSLGWALPADATSSAHVPLYRLRNPVQGEHFYTANIDEAHTALSSYGYVFEGVAGYIDTSAIGSDVPLYRLESSSSGHFYTTSAAEASNAPNNTNYVSEGIAGYVSPATGTNLAPLYRLRTSYTNLHFYTTSQAEANNAVANDGYVSEGIAGYLYTQP